MSSKINHIKRSHRSYAAHRNTAAAFAACWPIPERKELEYSSGMINPLGPSLVRGLLHKHTRRAAKG